MPDHLIETIMLGVYNRGIRSLGVTGGEPFCFPDKVALMGRRGKEIGFKRITIISNGSWGQDKSQAFQLVKDIKESGYDSLNISYDSYHAKHIGDKCYINIYNATKELSVELVIKVTNTPARIEQDKKAIHKIVGDHVVIVGQPIEPVGKGKNFITNYKALNFYDLPSYHCYTLRNPVVLGSGSAYACCCVSNIERNCPLYLGNIYENDINYILNRYFSSLFIGTINTLGMKAVYDAILADHAELKTQKFVSLCDFCITIQNKEEYLLSLKRNLPNDIMQRIDHFSKRYLI